MARRTHAEVSLAQNEDMIRRVHKEEIRRIAQIDRWIDFLTLRKNGATYQEIGQAEGITRERVRQICNQAIRVATRRLERNTNAT